MLIQLSLQSLKLEKTALDFLLDEAFNGEEALQKVKSLQIREGLTYGLILSDCQMPVMDGY